MERLAALRSEGLERELRLPRGIDFSSNDYLGLSRHPQLRQTLLDELRGEKPLSAPASRLLRGNLEEHTTLEERLARFKGTEAALLFPSGYQANLGLLTALLGPDDRVLSDQLNHASLVDGLRLSRARKVVFPHCDVSALERLLKEAHSAGRTFVVTESLFSMDGDIPALDDYADLAERHEAVLIVDDAHATGIYGDERGSGLTEVFGIEKRTAAITSTFGKAFGLCGAFVAGSRPLINWLVNRARPFVFSTAPAPLLLHAIGAALDLVASRPDLRTRVLSLADKLRTSLERGGLDCLGSRGPIVPVVLGDNRRTVGVACRLQERGFDVRAIRPPSVPRGTARLRISVHANHTKQEIESLAQAVLEAVGAQPGQLRDPSESGAQS